MDKKVIYGLGAVALLGAIWYFKKKKDEEALASMGDMGAMAEEPAEEGGAGGGGGGGASAPAPSDVAVGEMAKEEVKKSMDLGGLDMASKKVEKSAKVTAMVGSMASKGKAVPREMIKSVLKAPIPKGVKGAILSATMQGRTVQSIPKTAIRPTTGIVNKAIGKVGAITVTPMKKTVSKSGVAKANPVTKFKKFDGFADDYDNFDTDDMFANVGGNVTMCGSGGSCPQGNYCLTNATNVQTGQVGNYCVPSNYMTSTSIRRYTSARFDGDDMMDNFAGASDF